MALSILFLFFRNFIWISSVITLFQCYLLADSGKPLYVVPLLLTKLGSDVLIALMFVFFQGTRLYFFYNLGYTRTALFGSALLFDMGTWSLLVVLTLMLL
jgi:hypothetical protein